MAFVEIVEQPATKASRFRYEAEKLSHGPILGAHSTPDNKLFPTIRVVGYTGPAVVVVSCVTKEQPYKAHPHKVVGKYGCKNGVCTMNIDPSTMTAVFSNLGIQCVKKNRIEESLREREAIRVDPFKNGFAHRKKPAHQIDLNCVKLCFQVFIEGPQPGKFTKSLTPVVSDTIYNKKVICELIIYKMSHRTASAAGGQEIIILCDKVTKDDIEVRFFEQTPDGVLLWESLGEFGLDDVHKHYAISLRVPSYKTLDISAPASCWIELRRPSDGQSSERRPFQYTPQEASESRKNPTFVW